MRWKTSQPWNRCFACSRLLARSAACSPGRGAIFPVRDAVLVKRGVINAALAKALRMARKYIREADSITAGDSLAEVASLEGLPWIFQFAMLHTGCLSLRPPMSGCVRRSC